MSHYYQTYHKSNSYTLSEKEVTAMKNELLNFIENLTPEQVDKLVTQIPRLTSLLSGSSQLCHPAQTLQNQ